MSTKYSVTDPDLLAMIKALEQRVSQLERTPQVLNAAIDSRGLDVFGGGEIRIHDGSIKILDNNNLVRVQIGHLADGSYDLAAFNYVGNNVVTVDLATLAFGMQADFNTNNGSTTNNGYIDLDVPGTLNYGPEVTVTIGNSARAVVIIGCQLDSGTYNQVSGLKCAMSFAVSGASSQPAANDRALVCFNVGTLTPPATSWVEHYIYRGSYAHTVTGLTPGVNTFTAKYSAGSSGLTANFSDRTLIVIPF